MNSELISYAAKRITYTVKTGPTQVTITAHLPKGFFTMREYTRVYFTKTAKEFNMSLEEYILWEKEQLYKDLLDRIAITDPKKPNNLLK